MREVVLWALAIVAGPTYYVLSCAFFPFRNCGHCKARGRFSRKDGKVHRPCWWCGGRGMKLRYGRRVWNYFAKARKKAKRRAAAAAS